MCQFRSAIVMKNGDVLHNQWVDSHEELVTLNNLHDNGRGEFVRIEYVPQDRKLYELDKYKLVVDENETPEWFDTYRDKVERKMKSIIKNMIILKDTELIIGRRVIVKPGVNIQTIRFCVIEMLENSQVNRMLGNSQVKEMLENSQVNRMWENSQVNRMLENSQVKEMWENSQVNRMWGNSQVNKMLENSQVKEMWGNSQVNKMLGNSQVKEMLGNSQVKEMWGNSQVNKMLGNSQVNKMLENSQAPKKPKK